MKPPTFQEIILTLQQYWSEQGCVILQPLDMEVGAGTFHPATFLRALGPEPWSAAYVQPSRRPTDGRYGENPNRGQHYYQFQVVMKPVPSNFQDLYLGSLERLGINPRIQDIRFVEDNWGSPTLGAWGLGWEVWQNGMEITQFTYFQQVGGLTCDPVMGEITYGLERLAMYLQGKDSMYDLIWTQTPAGEVTYGDVFKQNEVEMSAFNFEAASVETLLQHFADYERECLKLIEQKLALPAYEMALKASHTFNLLDARKALSVSERQRYILRIRTLTTTVAKQYYDNREALGFPLLKNTPPKPRLEKTPSSLIEPSQNKSDFLLELGCEEIPAQFLKSLAMALKEVLYQALETAQIEFEKDDTLLATPRRLAVLIRQVSTRQPDQSIERRGPPLSAAYDASGNPTPALQGFLTSCGITAEQLIEEKTSKGTWLKYRAQIKGQTTAELLPTLVQNALKKLPLAKPMRWSPEADPFIRPVRWAVLMLGNQVISTQLFGQVTRAITYGHRFMAPAAIQLTKASDYLSTLNQAYVIVEWHKRYALCQQIDHPELSAEICGLVEYPVPLTAHFDRKFLALPAEVIKTSMQVHQKCFYLQDNAFRVISNLESEEPTAVIQGNERVMRARLSDALFFYENDLKQPLAFYREKLHTMAFQKGLGSLWDKTERIAQLAQTVAASLSDDPLEKSIADEAGQLCKADLATSMVNEFPELQGIMGAHYLSKQAPEKARVAEAIQMHYQLTSQAKPAVVAVALADRLDTLVGLFGIGEKPTGEKDPFALRRAALEVIDIILKNDCALNLPSLLHQAQTAYGGLLSSTLTSEVLDFIFERLRFLDKVYAPLFEGIYAVQKEDLADFVKREKALHLFLTSPEAEHLIAANKRIYSLLKKETATAPFNPQLLEEPAEKALWEKWDAIRETVEKAVHQQAYEQALKSLASLRELVDTFFNEIRVVVEDTRLKNNRLALLRVLYQLFLTVADFSRLS